MITMQRCEVLSMANRNMLKIPQSNPERAVKPVLNATNGNKALKHFTWKKSLIRFLDKFFL